MDAGHLHPRDLWQEAFQKLDVNKKAILSKQKAPKGANVVQEVEKIAQGKYAEYHKGGNGKSKVREGAEKTLKAILRFKSVVDSVVAFDSTHHGKYNGPILRSHCT